MMKKHFTSACRNPECVLVQKSAKFHPQSPRARSKDPKSGTYNLVRSPARRTTVLRYNEERNTVDVGEKFKALSARELTVESLPMPELVGVEDLNERVEGEGVLRLSACGLGKLFPYELAAQALYNHGC